MTNIRVLVLRAAGINCDEETAFAWETVGARAERLHVNRLIENPRQLADYQILTIPGGFSYGDDIASGKIFANQIAHHLSEAVATFLDQGGLVLGICNGFQVLVRLGLLPGTDCGVKTTLALNDSGRYEDRWVRIRVETQHCAFLEKGDILEVPVAHAEGKIVAEGGSAGVSGLMATDRVALTYVAKNGQEPKYPENPNGSTGHIAGLTDRTGRVLGLMPHPERNILPTHRPDWTSNPNAAPDGLRIFRRAVSYLSK